MLMLIASMLLVPDTTGATAARPDPPLEQLFSPDDYPAEALRRGSQGAVRFQLQIDSRGRLRSCKIISSSGDELLDRTTCDIVRTRARFQPARASSGKNVPGTLTRTVRWVAPSVPFQTSSGTMTVAMTAAGLQCRERVDGVPSPPLQGRDCLAVAGPFARVVELGGPGMDITLLVRFVPRGAAVPELDPNEPGILLLEAETELIIGEDGAVQACRTHRIDLFGPLANAPPPSDLCSGMPFGRQPFEPAEGAGLRFARVYMAMRLVRGIEI